MDADGWLFMTLSMAIVLALTGYCLYKVLSLPPKEVEETIQAQPDIDTRDLGT
jgi:hypothetical protein